MLCSTSVADSLPSNHTQRVRYDPHVSYTCADCGKEFNTLQAFRLHRRVVHKDSHDVFFVVSPFSACCSCCLSYFHNVARLLEHVMYKGKSRKCVRFYGQMARVNDAESICQVRAHVANIVRDDIHGGARRAKAHLPAYKAPGPKAPVGWDRAL